MKKTGDSIINPWEVKEVKDYGRIMSKLGVSDFSKYSKKLKNTPLEIRRGLVTGHKDFNRVFEDISKKEIFRHDAVVGRHQGC